MVIRSEFEKLPEVLLNQTMESKTYIVVKNHVREITKKDDNSIIESVASDEKNKKKKKMNRKQQSCSNDNEDINEISKSDLEELKSVYKKCRAVLNHIEYKYGHLLDLDSDSGCTNKRKQDQDLDEECNCTLNKKIVFNEDGQQLLQKDNMENHICPKKLRHDNKYYTEMGQTVQIENDNNINLPESIQELTELLKDPSISNSLRYSVIEKIKNIRQEHLNMIRFDRNILKEQVKTNPEEVMDFKGTNISSLVGYPSKIID